MLCFSVISRAPGLKLVVETLMSSLKPIGNIVVICCAFFIIFGILGVQVRGLGVGAGEGEGGLDGDNEKTKRQQPAMTGKLPPRRLTNCDCLTCDETPTILHILLFPIYATCIKEPQEKNSSSMHSRHYNSHSGILISAYLITMQISWLTAQGLIYTNEQFALGAV